LSEIGIFYLNLSCVYVKIGKIEKVGKLNKTSSGICAKKQGAAEMKKNRLLSLLFVATLFIQNAAAALLPYSSHYRGRSYFSDANVTGFVDFAVYDTEGLYGNEWIGAGFDAPGSGRYIYAYQVFCETAIDAIESFTIMGIDDPPTPHNLVGISTISYQNPWEDYPLITEGIEPSGTEINISETRATWEFAGGILVADEYSWFLVFSSDNDWVQGKYLMGTEGGFPITGNPEPCTVALLGLGSAILLAKRRYSRKVCSHK
jgi:hypothetical protein